MHEHLGRALDAALGAPWWSVLLAMSAAGIAFYLGLSGLSYLVFFVVGRSRFHPDYVPQRAMNWRAIRLGCIGSIGNVVFMLPLHGLMLRGQSRLYWGAGEYGFPYLVLSVIAYLVWTETCVYWVHRALHTRWLYRHVHAQHHAFRRPTSWVSMAFHPCDSFAQALPHHLFCFMVPTYGWLYVAMITGVSIWSVVIHDRVHCLHGGLINGTEQHTLHHAFNAFNYGQYTTVWDRLMGTWRGETHGASEGVRAASQA